MDTNAKLMASVARFDGARFLFRGMDADRFSQVWSLFREKAIEAARGDELQADRYLKVKVLRHDDGKGGSLRSIFVSGPVTEMLNVLPFAYAQNLSELHLKAYLVENFQGAHDAMIDGMYSQVSAVAAQVSFFGNKVRAGNSKSSGNKGIRIGSRKSDKHGVIYKRVAERTGVETRVKDKLLKRAVAEVSELAEMMNILDRPGQCWVLLRMKVGTVGYAALIYSLGEAGIDITDFFSHVSQNPDHHGPLGAMLLKGDQLVQNKLPE